MRDRPRNTRLGRFSSSNPTEKFDTEVCPTPRSLLPQFQPSSQSRRSLNTEGQRRSRLHAGELLGSVVLLAKVRTGPAPIASVLSRKKDRHCWDGKGLLDRRPRRIPARPLARRKQPRRPGPNRCKQLFLSDIPSRCNPSITYRYPR